MRPNTIQDVLLRLVICEPSTLETGCWEWPGERTGNGYGAVKIRGVQHAVHRAVYTHFCGAIPEGLHLDHLCRNPICANFEHLEPVTCKVNIIRGRSPNREKTHCPLGHPYDEANTQRPPSGGRKCKVCGATRARKYRKKVRDAQGLSARERAIQEPARPDRQARGPERGAANPEGRTGRGGAQGEAGRTQGRQPD